MIKKYLPVIFIFLSIYTFGQENRYKDILKTKYGYSQQAFNNLKKKSLFNKLSFSKEQIGNSQNLNLIYDQANAILKQKPQLLKLEIPNYYDPKSNISLELVKVESFSSDFVILNSKGQNVNTGFKQVHYLGIVEGNENSRVSLSMFENGEVILQVIEKKRQYTISKKKNSNEFMLFENSNVKEENPFTCFVDDNKTLTPNDNNSTNRMANPSVNGTCKTLKIYFEIDHDLYLKNGSKIENSIAFISGVFNQVKAIYLGESIDIVISGIKVWDTVDPYATINSVANLVNTFRNNTMQNYPGDVAHFISGRLNDLGGGIAYDIPSNICIKENQFCAMGVYNIYNNFPTYSWTVNVIAHEMGHILGSRHTHWCGWPGGPIDGCSGTVEKDDNGNSCSLGPIPLKGTIMSYCHQGNGIDLTLGFGPLPGNVLRQNITNSTCLTTQTSTTAPINLVTSSIIGNKATLSWKSVTNSSFYSIEYKPSNSNNWQYAGISPDTTIILKNLEFNQSYDWRVKVDCSPYSSTQTFITPINNLEIIEPVGNGVLCKGIQFIVPFTANNFLIGNNFILQLSDSSGSFTNPITIAQLYTNQSGIFSAQIPTNTVAGTKYKIRAIGNTPSFIGTESNKFSIINDAPINFTSSIVDYPSENSVRLFNSATDSSDLYYTFSNASNLTTAPTSSQIIAGNNAQNIPAIINGNYKLQKPNLVYSKIVGDLLPNTTFYVFETLKNSSACSNPVSTKLIKTTGTSLSSLHCAPIMNCTDYDVIQKFKVPVLGIDLKNGNCTNNSGFNFFEDAYYVTAPGITYTFELENLYFPEYAIIWFDSNNDGIFSSSEISYQSPGAYNYFAGNLSIPANLSPGIYILRVKFSYFSTSLTDPCSNSSDFGHVNDFQIKVQNCSNNITLVSTNNDVSLGIGKVYKAETINASNKININSASDYFATKSILLEPGFESKGSSVFKANIDPKCGNK